MSRILKLFPSLLVICSLVIWLAGSNCIDGGSGSDDPPVTPIDSGIIPTICYDLADMQQVLSISSN